MFALQEIARIYKALEFFADLQGCKDPSVIKIPKITR